MLSAPVQRLLVNVMPACNWTNGLGPPKFIPTTQQQVQQSPHLPGYALAEVSQQQQQILPADAPIHTTAVKEGMYGVTNDLKLGPVEKAVLHQAMYNQSKKLTPEMRRCNDCNVIFNSQNQAEMHYKGKKHAKVMFLKRTREAKRSSMKSNQLPNGIKEQSSAIILPESISSNSDIKQGEMGPRVEQYQEFEADSTSSPNLSRTFPLCAEVIKDPLPLSAQSNQEMLTVCDSKNNSISGMVDGCDAGLNTTVVDGVDGISPLMEDTEQQSDEDDKLRGGMAIAQREPVVLPDPLPRYISRIEKPTVLKESLRCTVCDIYVNSENQMRQHVNSLRHKNIEKGIPTPPKPVKEDKPKGRSEQFRCEVCRVTLNSDIQLLQHLSSQRHKNMLEGKPPKPRWTPYERTQHAILRSAAHLRLSALKTLQSSGSHILLPPPISNATTPLPITAHGTLGPSVLAPQTSPAHLKQMAYIAPNGGILQAQEIVYIGAPPPSFSTAQQPHQIQAAPAQLIQSHIPGVHQELSSLVNASCVGLEPRDLTFSWNP